MTIRKWVIDIPETNGRTNAITMTARRKLRERRAEQNRKFALLSRPERIGRFLGFERTHHWGVLASFAVVRA